MMTKYGNLYTGVSHHNVLSYRSRRHFKEDYVKMRQDWDADWLQIKKRILLGIDWHVIKRVKGFRDFQQRYI